MTHAHFDLARSSEVQNTIPNAFFDIAVTAEVQHIDLNQLGEGPDYVSLLGKRVRFRAITGNVTMLRGTHAGLTAGAGIVVSTTDPDSERYFIPPEATTLSVIAGGNVTLRCFYDD